MSQDKMYKERNPLPVVLVLVKNKKGEILLGKRKREPYVGYFGLIGGRQSFGKLTSEVVKEEVMTETGHKVSPETIKVKGLCNEILLDSNGNLKHHFLFRICESFIDENSKTSEEVEKTDLERFEWFKTPLDSDVRKQIIPTDLIFIESILSGRMSDFREFVVKEKLDGTSEIIKVVEQ